MGNLINRTIGEFKVQAFYQGKFDGCDQGGHPGALVCIFFLPG